MGGGEKKKKREKRKKGGGGKKWGEGKKRQGKKGCEMFGRGGGGGVRLGAVADFGTAIGAQYLNRVPLTLIKIDGSLYRRVVSRYRGSPAGLCADGLMGASPEWGAGGGDRRCFENGAHCSGSARHTVRRGSGYI